MRALNSYSTIRIGHRLVAAFLTLLATALLASTPAASQPATLIPVSGSGQSTTVNTLFPNPLKVIVQDAGGNTLSGVPITFTAPAGSASTTPTVIFNGAGTTYTVNSDATGAATVPAALLQASQRAAQYSVDVSAGAATSTILLINAAGPPATISVSAGAGQSGTISSSLATNLVALVVDGFGNPAPGIGVTFTAPGSGASGNFSGSLTALTTTDINGLATSPTVTLNTIAGVFNIVANVTSSPLSTPANFNLISLPGSPTQITVNQGSGQSTQISTNFGTTLRAIVRDANNNVVPGVTVTFTAPSSGASGTFSGGTTTFAAVTDASGIATASTLTANTVSGNFNVSATFSGGPSVNFALTNTPGTAANMAVQAGNNQSTTITLNFATNLSILLTDGSGNPVSGATVTFAAPGSGASGTFGGSASTTAVTNASGIATAATFKANGISGSYTITVTFGALTVTFSMTNVDPAAIIVNAGSGQSATVTKTYGTLLSAKVTDGGGVGIAGLTVTFTAPASGASGAFGGSATTTAVTNGSGIATASAFTANATAGAFNVAATVAGVASPANFGLTNVNPAAIAVQSGGGQQATVNTNFPSALVARVTDSGGVGIAGLTVTFTVPASGASGLFGGSQTITAVTNGSGDATAATLTANGTAGAFNVSASVTGVAAPATFAMTNLTPTPFSIAASPSNSTPQSTAVNAAFGTNLGAIIKDLNGNVLSNIPVTFTVNPVGGASGTFSGGGASATQNTNASGIATAPTFTANGTAGTYTVTATAGSLSLTFTLTNVAPAAVNATAGTPQTTLINTNFGTQLQVTVLDGSSNPVSGATVTFTAPNSGASGLFGASTTTTAVTNASGVATATIIKANGTIGTFTVNATVAGVGSPATFTLTNTAPASISASAGTPQSTVVSTNFGTQLQATVLDASSNPVAGATVTFSAPASGASGAFGGSATTTAVSNASGVATAAIIRANATTGNYFVSATVSGVATAATFDLTNVLATPATATASPSNSTPQSTAVNTAFPTALGVLVKDAGGTIIVGIPVTFTINGGSASGSFAGSLATTTVNTNASGIATAPTLTANSVAGAYTVSATVGSLTVTFNLANTAVPAVINATAGNNQSATISTNFTTQLQATVLDSGNNPIAGAVVVFTAPSSGARATFGGSATNTATTNASGVATAAIAAAGTTAGAFQVTATVQGTAVSTTFNLTNSPGAPSAITRSSGNAQSTALGANFAAPLVALVRDASNNPVPNVSVTFNAPASGTRGTFSGAASATVTTDSAGLATAPALTAFSGTGTFTIAARVNNTAPSVNFSATNTSAVPGTVTVQSGSGQTTVVNTNFASALQALVLDTQGNPSSGVTVTFTVPSSGASGAFSGATTATATTNASGIATTPVLKANTTSGTFFAQAAVSGIASPAVYTLTNTPDQPVSITIVSGTPQSTIVNTAFAAPLVAQVRDVYGNAVPNASVTFLAPTVGSVASFPGSTNSAAVTTDALGQATSPALTANLIAGTYTVSARIVSGSVVNFNLTNTPQPTSIAATGGNTQTTPVTAAFGTALSVIVKDATNLPVPNVVVTFTPPASGATATLSSATATTDATGVASVTATANTITGTYNVTAQAAGLASTFSFNLTNTAGAPATVVATGGSTQSTLVTTGFGTPLQVTVRDGQNNPVPNVTVTFTPPASGATANLSSTTATTNASGVASVTATANATVGSYTVNASAAGIATPITFNLSNTAGAPASIAMTGGSVQSTPVTNAFGTPLQVTVKDSSNNPVPGIVITFTPPASGATATLSSTTATTNALGVASVTATASSTAGVYNVSAAAAGIATPVSFSLTNTAGPAASISITNGSPQSTLVTTAFGTPLQVTVRDSNNNPVPGAIVTFTPPASGATATLSAPTATTNASGVASVTATANTSVGTYAVTATVPSVATTLSFDLTNTPGAPSSIAATGGSNQTTQVTTAFGNPLQVTVRDASNNPIPGITVTFVVPASGASATLSSLTAITNPSGVAGVTATANTRVGTYAVTATVAGVPTTLSFNLTNQVGPAALITASGGNTQSTLVTTPFGSALQITVTDSSGNPVPGITVTFSAPASGASAALSAPTAVTNASGIASITVSANGIPGSYVVTASVAGIATPISFNLTNTGTASLLLTVSASRPSISAPGQPVVFTYTVRNTGTLPASGVTVSDAKVTGITCPATTLAAGASMNCTATYVSTATDISNGTGIISLAAVSATTVLGPVASPNVTTPVTIDADALRRKTAEANKGLMMNRAQALTSMAPNAQRLHNRLTTPIFGDPNADEEDPAPQPRRHEPLKAFDDGAAERSTMPAIMNGIRGGIPARQSPTSMNESARSIVGTQSPLGRGMDGSDGDRAAGNLPFQFGGSSVDGTGNFSFSTSLSQMREAMQAREAALNGASQSSAGDSKRASAIDVWFESQSSYFTSTTRLDGSRKGHSGVFYAGVDAIVAPGVAIGAILQHDWIADSSSILGQNRDGAGWMAGPYIGLRLTRNIYFDARYERGSAINHVDPVGAYVDTFTSTRELASARLTGDWKRGAWTFRPSAELTYYNEKQRAYVNQIGIAIPDASVKLGRVTFGPELGYKWTLNDGSVLEPWAAIKGVYDFAKVGQDPTVTAGNAITGRVEGGINYRFTNGIGVRASAGFDGIGSSGYRSTQGQAFVIVPLN